MTRLVILMWTDAKPSNVRELYVQAARIKEEAARQAFLDEGCGTKIELRQRVEQLLAARRADRNSLLQRATSDSMSGRSSPHQDGDELGETFQSHPEAMGDEKTRDDAMRGQIDVSAHPTIGNYRLLEELGHGGMGTVYMAQQTKPVKRQVALKVIKPGMDSNEVIARFEAERQALAMMDHPHIARVLDGGTTDEGRPYFVMELVRGVPITEFCQRKSLPLRQRLELFVDICHAVQHAHQKGIIHRDLKPGNIMVTLHDGTPVVKVIDFGVAKALHQELTERTLFTHFSQMVGTPLYMAPEQAEMSGLGVDTRSDIYSLGVVLYELLTGTTPFDRNTMSKLGIDGIRKLIQEQEPPRPSARISTLQAKNRSTIEDQRQLDIEDIGKQLNREVDWIVMKALEKDRERRYETANAFAADVQRYLNDEPVEAHPPSPLYRLKKFAKKHKAWLTTAALLVVMLLTSTAVSGVFAYQANEARKETEAEKAKADERLKNETRARREADAHRKLADEQRHQASENLRHGVKIVDQMLMRVDAEKFRSTPGTEAMRRDFIQDGINFYVAFLQQVPEDAELQMKAAQGWVRVANLHCQLGEVATGQEARQTAVSILEKLHREFPDEVKFELALAHAITQFAGWEHWHLHQFERADVALRRSMELWQDLAKQFPENMGYHSHAAEMEAVLGDNYKCLNRDNEAETSFRHAISALRKYWPITDKPGIQHGRLCSALRMYSIFLRRDQERQDEASSLMKEAVERAEEIVSHDGVKAGAYWRLSDATNIYGDLLRENKQLSEAEKMYRRAIEAGQKAPRKSRLKDLLTTQSLWRAQQGLADILMERGAYSDAEESYLAAYEILKPGKGLPDLSPAIRSEISAIETRILSLIRKLSQETQHDEAIRICRRLDQHDGNDGAVLASQLFAAQAWATAGDEENATRLLDVVISREDATYYVHHQAALLAIHLEDSESYRLQCKKMLEAPFADVENRNDTEPFITAWTCALAPKAVDDYGKALRLARHIVKKKPGNQQYLTCLGGILLRAGKYNEAKEQLQKALAVDKDADTSTGIIHSFLAMNHYALGDTKAAQTQLLRANEMAKAELTRVTTLNRRLTFELLQKEAKSLVTRPQNDPAVEPTR